MKTLYIGNIPWTTTEDDLRRLCEPYGTVAASKVVFDHEKQRSRGFGFVEMEDDEADAAIKQLDQTQLDGRTIVVNQARERTKDF